MKIIPKEAILPLLDIPAIIGAVKQGFIAFHKGDICCPTPMQLLFHGEDGAFKADCHVKSAQGKAQEYFVIKIASGFYDNAAKGLPVNNGMVMVFSALSGEPVALLQDEGWLTAWRTAAAGALAASLREVSLDSTLGIIGTGLQAELQALFITQYLGLTRVALYGRSSQKAEHLAQTLRQKGLHVKVMASPKELCHTAAIVVTTTPSTSPVLHVNDLPKSLHLVALGSDSPGKIELDPAILGKAEAIITDDVEQCLHHGEFGAAVREGQVSPTSALPLGALLKKETRLKGGISVIDLTGLGVQDLAIASWVMHTLKQ